MANEAALKGGLIYEINVAGDFDKVIGQFETKIAELEARSKNLGKSLKATSLGSGSSSRVKKELTDEEKIQRKLKALDDQALLGQERRITNAKIETNELSRRQKIAVKYEQAQDVIADKATLISEAEMKTTIGLAKQATIVEQIRQAKARLATDGKEINAQTVAQNAALSEATVNKYDEQIRKQSEEIAKQTKERQRQEQQQEKENARLAENARLRSEVLAYSKQHGVNEAAAAQQLGISAQKAKELGFNMSQAQQFAQNFFFTFRRLVGILAIFTLARKFAQFLGAGVTEMTRFNGVLEQTQIELAAILSTVADINDSNGKLLEGQEKFAAATQISEEMMKRLRVESLTTTATFEDLNKAVTSGIAPGIAAGITDMKELVKTIVLVTKAASAIGIKNNQLAQEIRAAFTGTGSITNTRLFQGVLDPADIRAAKEQGRLMDYLTERLGPFAIASEKVAKSWDGLKSNMQDAIQALLASGGVAYFEALKGSMEGLINATVDLDKIKSGFGVIDEVINKDALAGVQEISSALADLINNFKRITSVEESFVSIRMILAGVGETLRLVGTLFEPMIIGAGKMVAIFASMAAGVLKVVRLIAGILPAPVLTAFNKILEVIGAILASSILWHAFLTASALAVRGLNFLLGTTAAIQGLIGITQGLITNAVKAWKEGLTGVAFISAVIQGIVSIWALVFVAIAAVIGVILYKTGALTGAFNKLNKYLGIASDKLNNIPKNMNSLALGIGAASEESKKLEDSFAAVNDKIAEMINKLKATILVANIRGEASKLFDIYADSYETLANRIRKNKEEEADLNRRIAEKQAKYSEEERKKAIELQSILILQKKNLKTSQTDTLSTPSLFRPASPRLNLGNTNIEAYKLEKDILGIDSKIKDNKDDILQTEADINALLKQRKDIQVLIAEVTEQQNAILYNQAQTASILMDKEKDSTEVINREFDARKALADEIYRLSNGTVDKLAQQTIEVARQTQLLEKNREVYTKSNDEARAFIESEKERIGLTEEDTLKNFELLDTKYKQILTEKEYQAIQQAGFGQEFDSIEAIKAIEELRYQEADKALITYLENMVSVRTLEQKLIADQKTQTLELIKQEANLKLQIKEKQKLLDLTIASNKGLVESLATGFKYGAEEFVQGVEPLARQFADNFRDALESAVSKAADALTNLLDPRVEEKTTVGEVVGEILLDFANQVFASILSQFVASLLTYVGIGANAQNANTIAIELLTASIDALTAALTPNTAANIENTGAVITDTGTTATNTGVTATNTGAVVTDTGTTVANTGVTAANTGVTAVNTGSTAVNTGATTANTGGLLGLLWGVVTQTAATIAQTIATVAHTAWLVILVAIEAAKTLFGFNKGGIVKGFNKGGKADKYVKGYASGGDTRYHPRPPGIPKQDTVPAWLTPGEFVEPAPVVRRWGSGFFEAIRRGIITPDMFGITPGMGSSLLASRINQHRGVYGMAEGGAIGAGISKAGGSYGGKDNLTVLPVMVADNDNMDQMVAGGRKSFNRRVKQATGQDNRNASAIWG